MEDAKYQLDLELGGDMNERSRRKKSFPKGLPIESDLEIIQKSQIVQSTKTLPIEFSSVSRSSKDIRPIQRRPYMIRRAYSEPLGYNMVENILLQRNFIID